MSGSLLVIEAIQKKNETCSVTAIPGGVGMSISIFLRIYFYIFNNSKVIIYTRQWGVVGFESYNKLLTTQCLQLYLHGAFKEDIYKAQRTFSITATYSISNTENALSKINIGVSFWSHNKIAIKLHTIPVWVLLLLTAKSRVTQMRTNILVDDWDKILSLRSTNTF